MPKPLLNYKSLIGENIGNLNYAPKRTKKLYNELCKEIENAGDLSSLNSKEEARLGKFQV